MTMRFLLTPVGSSGDMHPFAGLARALTARGHEVIILGAEPHRATAERAGSRFVPTYSAAEYHEATHDPDLWHPRRGLRKIMAMAAQGFDRSWQALEEHYLPGRTVLVGHPIAFTTRAFEEKTGAAAATLHLAPSSLRSAHQVPALPPGVDISGMPLWFKRALWRVVDRTSIDPLILPALNRFRARHGLPPVRRIFNEWINSPRCTVGLFPEWFGPRQPDWPARFHFASFPLWDDPDSAPVDAELDQFLEAGSPPIVFTPGTANRQARAFFAAAAEAVTCLGRRAIFLTGYPEQLPPTLPDTIVHRDYAPLSTVLPRSAALVHHGGIGTLAQGFATGVPQLMMPMGFDQPDNAMRATRLGVARWLAPNRFTATRVAGSLDALLGDERVSRAAVDLRDRLRSVNGICLTCEVLERLALG
jgi:rhamnosyltransferase subunit B